MKKKIIVTMLAATMLTAASTTAHAAASMTDNPLDGYAVTVYDQTTSATFAAGKDWPITTWYFFDEGHNILGSIPNGAVMEIAKTDGADNVDWEFWLADAFNDYRGPDESSGSAPSSATKPITDTESWALEVIELTNAERERHGLHPLEIDDELMELAQIRAEEVPTKYSHERPDGTTVVETHGCGENVGARKSAEKQVASWMNSEGHRTNILLGRYKSIGVGCYQNGTGKTYWVQVFRP